MAEVGVSIFERVGQKVIPTMHSHAVVATFSAMRCTCAVTLHGACLAVL